MTTRRDSEEAEPTRDEAMQPPASQYGRGDQAETIEQNPKSWAAWKREAERLQREVEYLTNAGVIECAVRNRSVSEYMNHWEDRTLKAESQLTALRQERDEARAILIAIRGWDMLDCTADGPYWKRTIDAVLATGTGEAG